jgi:hypothetical protein
MTVDNVTTSYQKASSAGSSSSANHVSIEGENSSTNVFKKKFVIGGVLFVLFAATGLFLMHKPAGALQDAAVAKAGLPHSKTGGLKLFDSNSTFLFIIGIHVHSIFLICTVSHYFCSCFITF